MEGSSEVEDKHEEAPRQSTVGKWPSSVLEAAKGRAASARKSFGPQLQNVRDATSKRLEGYHPINKMRDSAVSAASMGKKGMQPAISRVYSGSSQGYRILRTKLSSAAPMAEKMQAMGLSMVNDVLGDSSPLTELPIIDRPIESNVRFLEKYKRYTHSSALQQKTRAQKLRQSIPSYSTARTSSIVSEENAATACFSRPYILGTILLYAGDLATVAAAGNINRATRIFTQSEKKLWHFAIRYGGIPESMRLSCWEHTVRVEEARANSEQDYDTYLHMALSKGEDSELIATDVRRTYGRVPPHRRPEKEEVVEDVEPDEAQMKQLSDVLHALAGRFPTVGYCQGMDYIAAHVLRHTQFVGTANESQCERAFWFLVALFEHYELKQLFSPGLQKLQVLCFQSHRLFEVVTPRLSASFTEQKVIIEMFTVGWFQTLFLYLNALPTHTLDRVWDIFLVEKNSKILHRVAMALLAFAEREVLDAKQGTIDDVIQFLNTFDDRKGLLDSEVLLHEALRIKVTNKRLKKLQKQFFKRQSARLKSGGGYNNLM